MARRRSSVTAVTTPFDSCIAAMWAKAQHCSFRWDRPPGLASWPVLVPCRTRSTTANLPLCSPAPPPPDSPRYSERSWPTLPAPAPIVRFILPKRQAGASALAKPERIGNHLRHSFIHQFKMEPSGTGGRSIQAPVQGDEDFARGAVLQDLHGSWE